MIAQLTGTVIAAGATHVVLDVNGFGVKALCTPATAAAVRLGQPATLATSLVVREDSLTLYGFTEADERDCFELVQSASGIGPKIAQAVVSVLSPDALRAAIAAENIAALTKVPGIGVKGAQRLVIELKDKINALAATSGLPATTEAPDWREQVKGGLEGLGWSARDADRACDNVAGMVETDPATPVAVLMRAALRSLAK
ncbi:Holliday junction branch migration protein RuvA [Micropruina glycogenica]|uniref:Holliday junction branch migration complex subunit RuvA n=1 Tax=Micropruina glycogenica TaxID=75385 RepID=A0A2N9JG75_9ACTN|nr:Holliday junction branch migration protein RuvA [Micropruina glycogenica]SPD86518.1 Holliday junction ATP-dependent DNA helicase RuvA [Micropruina glycogenica]